MFETFYTYRDPESGQEQTLRLHGGLWVGEECVFEFSAPGRGMEGVVRADWREPGPRIELTSGSVRDPGDAAVLAAVRELVRPFHTGAFADLDEAALADLYAAGYHQEMGYATGNDVEAQRKARIADLTVRLTRPRKVLVAGCSAGECVRQLRARGVEAFGFDVCEDLERIAYPQARPYLRRGSLTEIPFAAEDGFDVITAIDVFEHVPEHDVPRMVEELARLRPRYVVALIAHCEFLYPGHVTLRPLSWWERALAPAFHRVPNRELDDPWPAVEPGSPDPTKLLRVFRAS